MRPNRHNIKKTLFQIAMVASMMLVFQANAQIHASSDNLHGTVTDNSKPISEVDKAKYRAADKAGNDKWVTQIQDVFFVTVPPYHNDNNKGHYFTKDYRLWTIGDLSRIDTRILGLLHDMAEIDDDVHLSQIMPDFFKGDSQGDLKGSGGIVRFKHCIEAAYYGNDKGWYGVKELSAQGR